MRKLLVRYLMTVVVGACVGAIFPVLVFPKTTPTLILGFVLLGTVGGVLVLCNEIRRPKIKILATGMVLGLLNFGLYLLIITGAEMELTREAVRFAAITGLTGVGAGTILAQS